MKTAGSQFFFRLKESFFFRVMYQALIIMIPFTMIMYINAAFLNLPFQRYQAVLHSSAFSWLYSMLQIVYNGMLHIFSPAFAAVIALCYTTNRGIAITRAPFYIIATLAGYGIALNIFSPGFSIEDFGTQGSFMAIFAAFISCQLFYWIQKHHFFNLIKQSTGLDVLCADAIRFIVPIALICIFWAAFNQLLFTIWGTHNLQSLIVQIIEDLFADVDNIFVSALLYLFLVHFLWLCGFHGSWMTETAAQNKFAMISPDMICNRGLIDVFVIMGGCGTSICVLLAILLFTKKKRLRRIAYSAAFPAIFNINEILTFGIPIILNPVLGIPFLLVPFEALFISYAAVLTGFMPAVTNTVTWTTPIFINGYLSTGSLRGAIVQLIILVVGTATYLPFIRINERLHEDSLKNSLNQMIDTMKKLEESNIPIDFLDRNDNMGLLAQMLLRDLKLAIKQKELFLLYQPQMDHDGKCIGAEALLRWKHPLFGYIYPPLIIYIAKAGSLLPALETQLFDMACAAIQKISRSVDSDFKVSVNITAKSLNWDKLENCIQDSLDRYQIPARNLWLEITEQDMLSNSQLTFDKLQRLKTGGHSLLIDDFGMGHTSLLYLQSNYFDVVKLDGSLVKSILTSETNRKIVSSIVNLSRQLKIDVIAEFVETDTEMAQLYELGCLWYQGYLFSPPVSLDDFIVYLQEHKA